MQGFDREQIDRLGFEEWDRDEPTHLVMLVVVVAAAAAEVVAAAAGHQLAEACGLPE